MPSDKMLCHTICGSVYRFCHRRKGKGKSFCQAFKKEKRRIHEDNIMQKEMTIMSKMSLDLTGEDTYDSMGLDISKSEFLENEIFFETQ